MKILFISKYTGFPENAVPSREYFLSKYLAKIGNNEVMLIGSRSTFGITKKFRGLSSVSYEGTLQKVLLQGPLINPGFNIKRLFSWIVFEINILRFRKYIQQFDPEIVIVSSLSILTFLTGIYLKKKLNAPLVLEIRDLYPLTLIDIGGLSSKHPAVKILSWVERKGYKNADLIVSTLPNASEHIKSILKKPFKFYWLPMGIDLDFYNSKEKKYVGAEINFEKKAGNFLVAYAGSFGKSNALDIIFEAAASLQDTHPHINFLFIGDGPLKKSFQERYQNLNNIDFRPPVSKKMLQNLLRYSDILINTWLDKPIYDFGISPNKWIDYMYAAKPMLVAYSGYKFIIEEVGCGVFSPSEDVRALLQAIIKFSEMPKEKLRTMGNCGKEYLINNLTYEILSKKLFKKLLSITGGEQINA